MAEIVFRFSAGANIVQKEVDVEKQLLNIYQDVERVNRSMSMKLKNTSRINWQMQQLLQQLETEKNKWNVMHNAMDTVIESYRGTEEGIIGAAWAGIGTASNTDQAGTGAESTDQAGDESGWLKFLKKILGNFGVVGTLPLIFADWGDNIKELKYLLKIVGSGASAAGNNGIKWGKLLGLPDMDKYSNVDFSLESVFSYAADEEFKGYFPNKVKTGAEACGDKIKVFTKWADKLLTVFENGYDNYQEHGGFSNPRFWQEFVTESAIDIGKGVLIGILASAGAAAVAAAGAATAPAWLAGIGISVGLDMGLDWIAQKVTGDSGAKATEVISDAIWDHAIPWLADTGKNIADAFGNAAEAVSGWLKAPQWAFGN